MLDSPKTSLHYRTIFRLFIYSRLPVMDRSDFYPLFQRPYQSPMLPTNLLDMVEDPYSEDRQLAAPKWFDEVDILRGFGILAVILIHVCGGIHESNLNALVITNMFIALFSGAFAVPLFIFVSGFSLSNKYSGSFSYSSFWEKRLKFIIPPYIIFSFFYLISSNGLNSMPSLHTTFNLVLTQNSYGFLWFIPLIGTI